MAATMAVGILVLRPAVRNSISWRATVTPLASIIGSGFLVVTPLLAAAVGTWAPLAMLIIVMLAYWVGSAIRIVIAKIEPALESGHAPRSTLGMDRVSRVLLGFAYVVSVAFYIRLMAAFVLRPFGGEEYEAQIVATVVLGTIGATGLIRGLHGLEFLEEIAVGLKLAVIAGLVGGLLVLNTSDPAAVIDAFDSGERSVSWWPATRQIAGMLLVVQGFETSRYLGAHYDAPTRIRSMRAAQLLSGLIYVTFVALAVRVFHALPDRVDETAILDLAREVTVVLVPMLVVAAVASQFSASIADTVGGGEMLSAASRSLFASGKGYVAVTGAAIATVWLTDVFSIVAIASRAFAAYYLIQTLMVVQVVFGDRATMRRIPRIISYSVLAGVLAFIVVFAIPAG